jgi:hypothetical protein
VQKHHATEQGRGNVFEMRGSSLTRLGAERENFQHLEPLGRRKRPFQSLNSTFTVGSFRCTNEGLRKFIPYLIVRSISAFVQSVPDQ